MFDAILNNPPRTAYLAGAGISVSSALPGAPAFITRLINLIADDPRLRAAILGRTFVESVAKRFEGDFLRFEAVIGCLEFSVDPNLDFLRVYSDCTAPNPYHFFLASQLEQGAIILTTNFDNLIEIACQTRGISYSLIVSEVELEAFTKDPASFKNPLIKLHGGYNVMYSANSRGRGVVNIKTTLEQVGRVYLNDDAGWNISALAAVLRDRHFVVMGYSGCDDFDIMPCMTKQVPVNGLTWIDHNNQPVKTVLQPSDQLLDLPPYRLLASYGGGQTCMKIISGNTASILGVNMVKATAAKQFDWAGIFSKWAKEHLSKKEQKMLLLGLILHILEKYKESVAILEGIPTAKLSLNQQSVLFCTLCSSYVFLNDEKYAILKLSEMAESGTVINSISIKGLAYYNLARINTSKNRYVEAEIFLNSAAAIFKRLDDKIRLGDCYHEMGRILIDTGKCEKGIKFLESATELSGKYGALTSTAIGYIELARALYSNGKLDEAEQYARKAMSIFILNGHQAGLGTAHHTLGYILAIRSDYAGASVEFKQAIEFERSAGDKLDLAHSLHSLGDMYAGMQEYDLAIVCLEEALKIKHEIKDKEGIANSERLLEVIKTIKALYAKG